MFRPASWCFCHRTQLFEGLGSFGAPAMCGDILLFVRSNSAHRGRLLDCFDAKENAKNGGKMRSVADIRLCGVVRVEAMSSRHAYLLFFSLDIESGKQLETDHGGCKQKQARSSSCSRKVAARQECSFNSHKRWIHP